VQETTFNMPFSSNDCSNFATIGSWLDALYGQASQKILLQNLDASVLTLITSVQNLQNCIEYKFKNKEFLINALTQSTFCYEFKEVADLGVSSNERLEFLGDSLVNLLVGKILYKRFPDLSEGDLSKLRGSLVNEHSLAKLAKCISLGENILLGKGEHKNSGEKKESILADAFEAIFAAIYLDSGEKTEVVENSLVAVIDLFEKQTGEQFFSLKNLENFDSKTQLQEISMALFQLLPAYKAVEIKNGGLSEFNVELWIGERKLAEGKGPSKKKLEKELARVVLDEKRYQ
jgi:ribonuclease-3